MRTLAFAASDLFGQGFHIGDLQISIAKQIASANRKLERRDGNTNIANTSIACVYSLASLPAPGASSSESSSIAAAPCSNANAQRTTVRLGSRTWSHHALIGELCVHARSLCSELLLLHRQQTRELKVCAKASVPFQGGRALRLQRAPFAQRGVRSPSASAPLCSCARAQQPVWRAVNRCANKVSIVPRIRRGVGGTRRCCDAPRSSVAVLRTTNQLFPQAGKDS